MKTLIASGLMALAVYLTEYYLPVQNKYLLLLACLAVAAGRYFSPPAGCWGSKRRGNFCPGLQGRNPPLFRPPAHEKRDFAMKKLFVLSFVFIVLVSAGVVVFHRPSREQTKRALRKMTPQPLARIMKELEHGKLPALSKSTGLRNKKPNPNLTLLEQSLRFFTNLVSAVPETTAPPSARGKSPKHPAPGPADPLEDPGTSPLSQLLNTDSGNFGEVLRRILTTGFSDETLNANRDLFEDLFPTPVPGKAAKKKT